MSRLVTKLSIEQDVLVVQVSVIAGRSLSSELTKAHTVNTLNPIEIQYSVMYVCL